MFNNQSQQGYQESKSSCRHSELQKLQIHKLINLQGFEYRAIFQSLIYPWEVLPKIQLFVNQIIANVPKQKRMLGYINGQVQIQQNVLVGQGTIIQHGAMIKGPTIIGRNCQIRKGAYIRGNAIIGNNCVIGNSTEIKNSILLDNVSACHFNYVGDSVLGKKAHLAAGAITSNLKLDSTLISIRIGQVKIETHLKKIGSIVGDDAEIGCNVVLNPGSIIGRKAVIYPGASVRGIVNENNILKVVQEQLIIQKY